MNEWPLTERTMCSSVRFWPDEEMFTVLDSPKNVLRPLGLMNVAVRLIRLEWALSYETNPKQLALFLQPLRDYETAALVDDIGREARVWHDWLVAQARGSSCMP